MKYRYLIIASLMLNQSAARASGCADAQSQADMNQCAAAEYQKADQHLNQTYQSLLQRADAQQQELLRLSEEAWMKMRDADCKFVSSGAEGGSARTLVWNQCLTDKTRERSGFLESFSHCDEGDLSCPVPSQR
ncbi:DUF1311 domain-containing protein [Erwinia sp. CPCC 100877]|nr:DUF1311 domain-containing protein [Erwinia sp. CPCC 100877]